jgi:DNA-binding CsgD family transcriptional regulator
MPWRTRIVGRARETAELDTQWQRAAEGEFRFLLLLGEPGVGKTRLAAEALESRRRASIALSARAHPLGATASFGLWAEALERHLRALPLEEVARLSGGLLDDLASLLRSVAAVRGAVPDREPPRPRLLEGLAVLLSNLAAQAPVVVVLDDLHLADASSWDALHYLAGSLPAERILVVGAARPAELADQPVASRVLLDLEQGGTLERLEVGPLGDEAVRELAEEVVGGAVGPGLVTWLSARARGNPLFALGLLQALLEEGADLDHPALRSLPEGLAERIRVRMGRFEAADQAILDVLAVAGSRVELADLVGLSRLPLEELGLVLQRLVRTRLVAEEERGRKFTYEISHPIIQEIVYEDIVGARRVVLHRQVGRALLTLGRLGEAAPHFACSAEVGDPEALAVLGDALRQAEERGAYREGLRILGALVEVLPAGDRRWVEVADAFSWRADWVVDHRAEADFLAAIDALRAIDFHLEGSGHLLQRAAIKARLTSFLSWGTGELDEAEKTASDALSLYQRAGDRTGVLLAGLELAYVRGLAGDLAALEGGARQVLTDAEVAGDRSAMVRAVGVMGTALFYQGHFGEAEAALHRSIAVAREESNLYRLTWGLMSLGWSLGLEGRVEEAVEAFAEAKAANPAWRDSNVLELEGHVRWLAGDLRGALGCAYEAFALNPGSVSLRRGSGACTAALATAETGELDETRRHVAAARRIYGRRAWFFVHGLVDHADGVLAWREGRRRDALGLLRRSSEALVRMGALPFAAPVLVDLAELAAGMADTQRAAEAAEVLDQAAEAMDRDLYRAMAAAARAWAALAAQCPEEAATASQEAVGILDGLGYEVLFGRVLDLLGRSAADPHRAVDALERAAAVFDACGAVWRRDHTVEVLRTRGASGRRAAAAAMGPTSLTARELEVARLAARRLTAAEIAHELFISRRTVEGHLANVYAKLGVHSKREFSQRASTLGLV